MLDNYSLLKSLVNNGGHVLVSSQVLSSKTLLHYELFLSVVHVRGHGGVYHFVAM